MLDGKALGAELVEIVRDFVSRSFEPVNAKIAQLEELVTAIPAGKDGVPGKDGEIGPAGKDGAPGKDAVVDYAQISLAIKCMVTDAVALLPKPRNGIDGKDGAPGKDAEKAIDGRDGRDGLPGLPGLPGDPGKDGRDGVDGFGLEDFDLSLGEDGRTLSFKFVRGEVCKERQVIIPTVLDKGIYRAETAYAKGDGATWDGSWWIAQADTKDKPGTSPAWRLAAKRGRDGRDGKDGTAGIRGPEGPRGRDLTQIGPDGSRF